MLRTHYGHLKPIANNHISGAVSLIGDVGRCDSCGWLQSKDKAKADLPVTEDVVSPGGATKTAVTERARYIDTQQETGTVQGQTNVI